ncbi:stanniocalcin-2 [Megalops cyprinoides]|uniref:stanniocalcin-2 n=1 Tax=Megalops cyprinoides TaxID=118141 RepID=UPI001865564C|nr:stanniocalcin-2 [Megalops cyprinoides]
MLVKCAVALFVFAVFEHVLGTDLTDVLENPQEKPTNQQKGRISLQNTAEIQHCLVTSGDVGCGVFECLENNSCEIRGLHEICMTFLHNAGKFDPQGKSFIKDALRCMAHGLRHKFGCVSRKCLAVKEMVLQLQRDCYAKYDLCSAIRDNVNVMVQMIHFQDLFPKGPHVELVNILLGCGEQVKEALAWSVRLQCEQNWGALCDTLTFCAPGQQPPALTTAPVHRGDPEGGHTQPAREGGREKGNQGAFESPQSQVPQLSTQEAETTEQGNHPETSDMRR